MKITFPHMGNAYIAAKALFEDLGNEVVLPPICSKRTLEIGTKYSPETICLPLKINIGNYIESIEKGADTVVITGSCGPCRFGFYPTMEQEILKELGYDAKVITFEPFRESPKDLIKSIATATNTKNIFKIIRSGYRVKSVLYESDDLIDFSNKIRARALNKIEVDIVIDRFYKEIENVHGVDEILKLIRKSKEDLKDIKIDKNFNPLKIGIIGEIYTVIEPFVNLEIEKKLGYLGIEVEKAWTPSRWAEFHLYSLPFGSKTQKQIFKEASPYLDTLVGGHGRETIGTAIMYAKEGYDGLVQLLPLACMPEIVAESILPTVQKDLDIPILTLVIDEMTGEAGYLTRLEAFTDLLKKRRDEKENEKLLLGS
ncbi:hypothetical protein DUF2229 [Gottschalkia acidurici 9a]|uniref:Uncharacterized protein n=1 Tax=Gottschalkia acidurici (strain ATCC 7906 / DSM 604 / BCRC 14475 / CIP 104303 / KCTC 5404 / NCIMB 10678 / 9a) TaxID=1128398 RepID=K0AZ40_GOTA9|nr:acyl-CoA dehydratase activase-related protein [Gottschalkia acidurici]AFS77955.1 hypothetical protein DUF2229 [Gottschalkia acidurici 9a]